MVAITPQNRSSALRGADVVLLRIPPLCPQFASPSKPNVLQLHEGFVAGDVLGKRNFKMSVQDLEEKAGVFF